jgi:hypothetical protein
MSVGNVLGGNPWMKSRAIHPHIPMPPLKLSRGKSRNKYLNFHRCFHLLRHAASIFRISRNRASCIFQSTNGSSGIVPAIIALKDFRVRGTHSVLPRTATAATLAASLCITRLFLDSHSSQQETPSNEVQPMKVAKSLMKRFCLLSLWVQVLAVLPALLSTGGCTRFCDLRCNRACCPPHP